MYPDHKQFEQPSEVILQQYNNKLLTFLSMSFRLIVVVYFLLTSFDSLSGDGFL